MARASKSSAPSRLRDRARHEDDVIQAALRLFAKQGFGPTTICELATESGFSVATLYNLFGSKEAILQRVLEQNLDAFHEAVSVAVDAGKTPRERLKASVLARARFCEEHRDFFALYAETYSSLPPKHGDRVPERMQRAVSEEVTRLEGIFRELPHAKLDAASRALAFYGATRAYVVERVLRSDKSARAGQIAAFVDAVLDGLAPGA